MQRPAGDPAVTGWPAGRDRNSAVNPIQLVGNGLETGSPIPTAPRGEPLGTQGHGGVKRGRAQLLWEQEEGQELPDTAGRGSWQRRVCVPQ